MSTEGILALVAILLCSAVAFFLIFFSDIVKLIIRKKLESYIKKNCTGIYNKYFFDTDLNSIYVNEEEKSVITFEKASKKIRKYSYSDFDNLKCYSYNDSTNNTIVHKRYTIAWKNGDTIIMHFKCREYHEEKVLKDFPSWILSLNQTAYNDVSNKYNTYKESLNMPPDTGFINILRQFDEYDYNSFMSNIKKGYSLTVCFNLQTINSGSLDMTTGKNYIWKENNKIHFLPVITPDNYSQTKEIHESILEIPLIEYYTCSGELVHETNITNEGQAVNIPGAIVGGLIAGDTGAIIGSRPKNNIRSETVTKDTRLCVLSYLKENRREYIFFDNSDVVRLKYLLPEKYI